MFINFVPSCQNHLVRQEAKNGCTVQSIIFNFLKFITILHAIGKKKLLPKKLIITLNAIETKHFITIDILYTINIFIDQ